MIKRSPRGAQMIAERDNNSQEGAGDNCQSCDNPVEAHYLIGQQIGIKGTPAIISSSGEMLLALPPERLAAELAYNTSFSSTLIVQRGLS